MDCELSKERFTEIYCGIKADNREHPGDGVRIPCNDCKRWKVGTLKCPMYPGGIPRLILLKKEKCPHLEKK